MTCRRTRLCSLSLLLILGSSPGFSANQEPAAGSAVSTPKMDRLSWSKEVDGEAPIRHLQIRNDFGDIRARFTEERKLEAWAVVQRLDPGSEGVGFTVERRGDTIALAVAYPPGRIRDRDPDPPRDSFDRLDLTVFIPEGVSLGAETLRGMVEARGLRSQLTARTQGGDIFAATSGTIQASSSSGAITAFVAATPTQPLRPFLFQSASGPMTLTLSPGADLAIELHTAGVVTSWFPLERHRGPAGNRARARLGHGRLPLLAVSETGPIDVRRAER